MSQLTFFISQLNHQIYNISKLVCSVCGVFEELVICKKKKKIGSYYYHVITSEKYNFEGNVLFFISRKTIY